MTTCIIHWRTRERYRGGWVSVWSETRVGQESWAFLWGSFPARLERRHVGRILWKGGKGRTRRSFETSSKRSCLWKNYPVCSLLQRFRKDRLVSFKLLPKFLPKILFRKQYITEFCYFIEIKEFIQLFKITSSSKKKIEKLFRIVFFPK